MMKGQRVEQTVGLVFLHENDHAQFVHDGNTESVEEGKLIVFEGNKVHYTEVLGEPVEYLGPFTMVMNELISVGPSFAEPSAPPSQIPTLRPSQSPSNEASKGSKGTKGSKGSMKSQGSKLNMQSRQGMMKVKNAGQ
jgi:hypothetical protein